MTVEPTSNDKQITVDVPEARVAEFYAFYGRFLAGSRRRHRHGPRGHGCRSRREARPDDESATPATPQVTNI
jgi:hypothetical protein